MTKTCPRCGREFTRNPSKFIQGSICSRACAKRTPLERLMAKTQIEGDCWTWIGCVNHRGYGQMLAETGDRLDHSHRVSFRLHGGVIPDGHYVCHSCDNRACVNPAHLFTGTPADNSADMVRKRRHYVPRGDASPNSKVTEADVRAMRAEYDAGLVTQRALALRYGMSKGAICHIVTRRDWKHVA